MSQMSNYLENAILDDIRTARGGSPDTLYLALYTSNPGEDNSGTEVEIGGSPTNGYARQECRFNPASGGQMSNAAAVTFPEAVESWGTITHWALLDSVIAGNLYIYGALTNSRIVSAGDTISFAAAAIVVTAD